jgi:hypothetical protein
MSDDPAVQMYEAQAELAETKERLEVIQKENNELRDLMGSYLIVIGGRTTIGRNYLNSVWILDTK